MIQQITRKFAIFSTMMPTLIFSWQINLRCTKKMKPRKLIEVSRMLRDDVGFICNRTGSFVLQLENLWRNDVLCHFVIGWTSGVYECCWLFADFTEKFGSPSRELIKINSFIF